MCLYVVIHGIRHSSNFWNIYIGKDNNAEKLLITHSSALTYLISSYFDYHSLQIQIQTKLMAPTSVSNSTAFSGSKRKRRNWKYNFHQLKKFYDKYQHSNVKPGFVSEWCIWVWFMLRWFANDIYDSYLCLFIFCIHYLYYQSQIQQANKRI